MRFRSSAWALLSALSVAGLSTTASSQTKSTAAKQKAPSKSTAKRKAPVARRVQRPPAITPAQRQEASEQVQSTLLQEYEPFDNGAALVPFFERLYRLGKDVSTAHVLQYGDSHTASDDFAAVLRESMQGRFGNGGPGFSMPGSPYLGYRRRDLGQYYNSRGWYTQGALFRRGDGLHGLGGVSLTAYKPGETVVLRAQGDTAELLFLQQPNGGSFDLYIDGQNRGSYSTEGPLGPATLDLTTIPGERHFMIRTSSAKPVRLLGTVVDNTSGITWESAGINGAHASIIGEWDERLLATHLHKRDPALIVLAYGTNEANVPVWDSANYWSSLQKVVGKLRAMAPQASILMVGPPDCRVRSMRGLDEVIQLQRKMAVEARCSFWDWRARMGGPGSMRNWVLAGLGQGDHIHFTSPGYQRLGQALFEDLMRLYDRFVRARMEAAEDGNGK